jgi:uncharacterized membrane protein
MFPTARLEAFCDAIIAVIITIMVLDLRVHTNETPADLLKLAPVFAAYIVSFIFLAICWINHHSILSRVHVVDRHTLWLNVHWLFWMSLFPFATSCVGASHMAYWAVSIYALLQAAISLAYRWLVYRVAGRRESAAGFSDRLWQSESRRNAVAVGVYLVAAAIAFVSSTAALALIVAPALAYFMPNRHAGMAND